MQETIDNMLTIVIRFASQDCNHITTSPQHPSPPPTGGWNLDQLVVRELSGGIYIDATVFAAVRARVWKCERKGDIALLWSSLK